MSALRSGRVAPAPQPAMTIMPTATMARATAPAGSSKPQVVATSPHQTFPFSEGGSMKMNTILLTSGDEKSGTVQLPPVPAGDTVQPTLDATSSLPVLESVADDAYLNMNGYPGPELRRSGRPSNGGGKLIEFFDPELEQLDVDDYQHSVLLVGGSNTEEPANREASELLSRKLTDIRPSLSYAWGDIDEEKLPTDFYKRMDKGEYTEVVAPRTVFQWEPTNLWYHPLYFEDVGLERYGHTRKPWVQPFVSTGRFFGQVAMLPYQMTLHPPKAQEFALGHYQPGEWAPKKRYQIPFNEEATTVELLWITGLILLIP